MLPQTPPSLPALGSDAIRYNITRSMRGARAFANIRGAQRCCSVVGPRSFIGVDTCRADALLMHELLGSEEVMEWLNWSGSQQGLLRSSALGKLLQASFNNRWYHHHVSFTYPSCRNLLLSYSK